MQPLLCKKFLCVLISWAPSAWSRVRGVCLSGRKLLPGTLMATTMALGSARMCRHQRSVHQWGQGNILLQARRADPLLSLPHFSWSRAETTLPSGLLSASVPGGYAPLGTRGMRDDQSRSQSQQMPDLCFLLRLQGLFLHPPDMTPSLPARLGGKRGINMWMGPPPPSGPSPWELWGQCLRAPCFVSPP